MPYLYTFKRKSASLFNWVFIIACILCLAIAIAAGWIAYQFIGTYRNDFHKNYFYYLLTFYGFAIYGLWAQIIVRALVAGRIAGTGMAGMIGHFLTVLSLPFLFISWLMLVKMGYSLVNRVPGKNVIKIHLSLLAVAIALSWVAFYLMAGEVVLPGNKMLYVAIAAILTGELAYLLNFIYIVKKGYSKLSAPGRNIVTRFVFLIFIGWVLRAACLSFMPAGSWYPALLMLVFFLSGILPLLYLKRHADSIFTPVFAGYPSEEKKSLLFAKYEITKREREIVNKICEGKTNQQIADELFISLQTVKDHTHRIYTKIGIHSRLRLVQLVNG